jgi:hypothetical protein
MHDAAAELSSFAELLAGVSQASKPETALPKHELEDALVRLGFEPALAYGTPVRISSPRPAPK